MAKSSSRQSYRYTGPVITQKIGSADRTLFPGTSYQDLPPEDPIVKNLIARRVLIAETAELPTGDSKALASVSSKGA